ncbi:hypothetical protein ScPMuIL_015945 [Solemya velum]
MPGKNHKTSKSRGETSVQGTNDSSIVSKCSMIKHGYIEDNFLHYFVCKQMRRAPLINRGYFIRAATIEFIVRRFIQQTCGNKQIISLGAGFDSQFFRLQSSNILKDTVYYEIDFPEVAGRKRDLIFNQQALLDLLPGVSSSKTSDPTNSSAIVIDTDRYKLIGVDLSELRSVESILKSCGLAVCSPTLLLSEVVLTYMNKQYASAIIRWAANTFSNAVFVMYEQINPSDGFGVFMQNHFKNIGSPLKCLQTFPSIQSQRDRFTNLGWDKCDALDMNQYYYTMLSVEERLRVNSLEPFDEFEGWHAKCSHYFVLCAYRGATQTLLTDVIQAKMAQSLQILEISPYTCPTPVSFSRPETSKTMQMYSHQSVRLSDSLVLTVGGFGEQKSQHCRLPHFAITDTHTFRSTVIVPDLDHNVQVACMYTASVVLKDGTILLVYGRFSPAKPYSQIVSVSASWNRRQNIQGMDSENISKLNISHNNSCYAESLGAPVVEHSSCEMETHDMRSIDLKSGDGLGHCHGNITCTGMLMEQNGEIPCSRWRHTCSLINITGDERIFLYGGRNQDEMSLGDCFLLNPSSGVWTELHPGGQGPGDLQSHTACVWKNSVVIAGGLDADLKPQNQVFTLNLETMTWTKLLLQGLMCPRYSHTAHVINSFLILIGGASMNHLPPGVAVIHLPSGICREFPLPPIEEKNIIMLHSHTSTSLGGGKFLILGGGGNCFSFGTHLNKSPFILNITDCLKQMKDGICDD